MEEASSKYNINVTRDVYLCGDAHHTALVQKLIKGYSFLYARDLKHLNDSLRADVFFVVAAVDFSSAQNMQAAAQAFGSVTAPLAHRVIFAIAPLELSQESLLFAQEIGARYVATGPRKNDDLKDYLKRVCLEAHQVGSLAAFEQELTGCYRAADQAGALRVMEKLKALPTETEESTRLLVLASMYANDLKRAESYLKRLLTINPQHLWAANQLGRLFLRSGRAAQGIEILQRMSQYHELNSERHLALGDAYVQAGMADEARDTYKKGVALVGAEDQRFATGEIKVRLVEKDFPGAFALLDGKPFSQEVISFLNMRAIISIRAGRYEEGFEYYKQAARGAGESQDMRAKILFNMGLAYVRVDDLAKAQDCFFESCQIGGPRFQRARGPLDIVKGVIKNKDKEKANGTEKQPLEVIDEIEFETLY